jgi:hypothetical protein
MLLWSFNALEADCEKLTIASKNAGYPAAGGRGDEFAIGQLTPSLGICCHRFDAEFAQQSPELNWNILIEKPHSSQAAATGCSNCAAAKLRTSPSASCGNAP